MDEGRQTEIIAGATQILFKATAANMVRLGDNAEAEGSRPGKGMGTVFGVKTEGHVQLKKIYVGPT